MLANPRRTFRCWGQQWEISGDRPQDGRYGAFDALMQFIQAEAGSNGALPIGRHVPFVGGVAGYLSYDFGRLLEPALLPRPPEADDPPDAVLGAYDDALLWDHANGEAWRVGKWALLPDQPIKPAANNAPLGVLRSRWTADDYHAAVKLVRERIAAGEVYQINLAQRFEQAHPGPAAERYLALRQANPGPFSAYFDFGEGHLLSTSPECFWELQGRLVRTFPIKGTQPRGSTPQDDIARRATLAGSPKEQAELRMIVDLMRNDLGRVCRYGSVQVLDEGRLESYVAVHHRVATIQGELKDGLGATDLLAASFPGGSITGAPKIQAMHLIDQLEGFRRGPFCGSIGYVSRNGNACFNIAIRTAVHLGNALRLDVGSGIVWDSDPLAEYHETLAKVARLLPACQC